MISVHHAMQTRYDFLRYTAFKSGIKLLDFELFEKFYNAPNRTYHNFNHLNQMYKTHEKLQQENAIIKDLPELNPELTNLKIELFIWWHDVIYDPRAKNNEELSATLFSSFTERLNQGTIIVNEIYQSILDSRHLCDVVNGASWSLYCLDLDLSALIDGQEFTDNGLKIRQEFSHLMDWEFYTGRRKFFEALLNRSFVFHNPYDLSFYDQGEPLARINIKNEIETLKREGY